MANTRKNVHIRKDDNRRVILLAAVLAVVVIGVVVSLMKPRSKPVPPVLLDAGNLEANMTNGGTAVLSGSEAFIADPVSGQVLRIQPGKTTGVPLGDIRGRYLNVSADALYYVDADTRHLMRARPDGADAKVLLDRPVSKLLLYDGWLYYLDGEANNTLYRLNTADGSQPELLSDARVMQYAIANGQVFYHDLNRGADSFVMDLDGANPVQFPMRFGQLIFTAGNRLFYTDVDQQDVVCYIEIEARDGKNVYKNPKNKNTGVISGMVAEGDMLYYVSAADGLLYRVNVADDASIPEALTAEPVYGLQIAGGYVYYSSVTDDGALGCVEMAAKQGA